MAEGALEAESAALADAGGAAAAAAAVPFDLQLQTMNDSAQQKATERVARRSAFTRAF